MYKFKEDNMRVPCYVWSGKGSMEQGAIDQVKNASSLPFVYHHTALMPDAHQGYGVSIGSVIALENMICPYMVGVDIGCGMCAIKTSLTEIDQETLKKIMGEIRKAIPVGFSHHQKAQDESLMPRSGNWPNYRKSLSIDNVVPPVLREENYLGTGLEYPIIYQEYNSALKQLGTLGGGNHFIEIQKGSDGHIWIMLHSGSRNLGKKVADYHNKIAVELNEKWYSKVPKEWQLAFLPIDSEEGQTYLREMQYCVDFALANRRLMMNRIKGVFRELVSGPDGLNNLIPLFPEELINIAHNYASMENHFGANVMVHRKGATLARENTIGIIPGSMGTASYIVKGKGNKESFESCSHGAGRKMGRKEAIRSLDFDAEIKNLNDKGVIHGIRNKEALDEAPGAYKDISTVMREQEDLVEIIIELRPLAVIKG